MQSRRVGTLTLGLLLIILGILYFLFTVFNIPFEKRILDFWPLIFISLGVEVLVLSNKALKNNIPLRYDFISFILIAIIIAFSFCTFTASKFLGVFLDPSSPLHYRYHIY
ncbi:LiaI-LiaF-like domain-containing protein [Clostridium saccharoperbutylacetonicum]|uniref:LiaI-LiaF-like domain-containing protein n=1 Tax=Clostridium saccharoperbutylacetonicum TaxID=36745 RepID=UPI000983F4C0|nr:DUF5668 domain-containing protein [Clostridium saccharoperbutylacetonicum]AQR93829.1 hypothetical protein CLSAP_11360 [Clostridium saccharoperbutylacetonicum]NSB29529.1 magnesium-transporting ATPase (P-type) [Clostridium saccharoperbutylacetonicum]